MGKGPLVIFDPKGDRELLARAAKEAHRHGRRFALIAPAFPAQSASINVLDTCRTPAEVSSRIAALMPIDNDVAFYREYPLAVVERIAGAQAALGRPWTLEGLYRPAVQEHDLELLLFDYLGFLGCRAPRNRSAIIGDYRKNIPANLIADGLIDDLTKPRDHFSKVTANLIPTFRGVIGEPLGRLFSALPADVTWGSIVEEEMVVYIALASMLLGDVANRIGRVILQDFVGYLGRRYAYENMDNATPITVLIDEFGDVAYPLFTNALNKGGGAHARFILAQQSLADPEAAMGPAQARRTMDNLNTKIWCRLADDTTAEEATKGLGLCTVKIPETGVGLSYGGVGGLSGSSNRRLAAKEVPLIRPTWLTALPRGTAFVRMKGEVHMLSVPLLTPVSQEDLDMLGLSAIWDALDPKKVQKQGSTP